jgi:thiamine pyrophosphate-dependent acetolactate synthase large subunit-like protein
MNGTVADLILAQLNEYGVKNIFGVIGDSTFPLADALSRQEKICYIPTTIETAASFMASFTSKLSGTLGVCIASAGPGAVNIANGVGDAYLDNVPLLCITGQVTSSKLGTDYKQYINQTEFFEAITDKSRLCTHSSSVLPILTSLMNHALTFRTSVHMEIPQDILVQPINQSVIPKPDIMSNLNGTKIYYGQLEKALEFMAGSARPIIIIGKEACNFGTIIASYAKSFGAAIVVSRECKGTLPDSNPQVIGGIGEAFLPECFSKSDCILLFGEAIYEERFIPAQTQVIQFRNTTHSGYTNYLEINGDYDLILRAMREKFPQFIDRQEWRIIIENTFHQRTAFAESVRDPKHPLLFFNTLSQVVSDNAIITLDVGEFVYWFDFGFLAKHQQVGLSTNWRSMGGGIPAGIAACLQNPGKQVITIVGDGGFLMSMNELTTIQRYQLPLTIFVLKNQCYGLEIQKMAKEGFRSFGTDLVLPDMMNLANAFHMNGYQLKDAINKTELQSILQNTPALVEVEVHSITLPNL